MRVLFLHQQPCIRTLKHGVGLRAARPGLELGYAYRGRTLSEFYGAGDELFDVWWRLGDDLARDLADVVEAFAPDVIHGHNLPDLLTVLALEATEGRVPVVHDVHDLQSLRRTPYEDGFPDPGDPLGLERRAVEGCAALITVSEELLEEVGARHALPAHTLVVPNHALARDLPAALPDPDRPAGDPLRLVYQGSLSTSGGHYDLRGIFAALAEEGLELHVHPAKAVPAYARVHPGIHLHPPMTPVELMRALPRYDLGWAGFNAALNAAHLDTALPNKVFEYLGCGLPVVTLDHRALRRFIRAERLGLSVDGVAGLGPRLRALDLPALRRRVAQARARFTVEAGIGPLLELYDELVAPPPDRGAVASAYPRTII